MNKEDTIRGEHSGSPERVFLNHQKLKNAIWEVYSKDLKVAQDQDIILPSSQRTGIRRLQSPETGTDQGETKQIFNQATGSNSSNKKFLLITKNTLPTEMERNTNTRSISPQLNEILDFVVGMELKQEEMEVGPSNTEIQYAEVDEKDDRNKSNINSGDILTSQKRGNRDEINNPHDVNLIMNNDHNYSANVYPLQTDEEKDKLRLYSKRLRLPGIEQVINKTSFANQRSDYYNRTVNASLSNDTPHGADIAQQQFSNPTLQRPQTLQTMSPSDNMSDQGSVRYIYPNSLPGTPNIARPSNTPESNERPMADLQGCYNNPLINPAVSRSETWPFPNINQSVTPSLTSPPAQFQNNVMPQRETSGILELGTPRSGQTSPSVSNMPTSLKNNQYHKHKIHSAGGCCLPIVDGTVSPMENIFPPNAMVTRSDPSCPLQYNRPILIKDNEYQNNLHCPSDSLLISSSAGPSKLNQNQMHLPNVNAQKPGLGSMTQSPYSPNQVLSPYNAANLQGHKTPPIFTTNANTLPNEFSQQQPNFMCQQNLQYSSASPSAPSRPEFIQLSPGQMGQNPASVNMQSVNYGPKNLEMVGQKGFPIKKKSQWSGSSGITSAHYKNVQGFPTPISSPRVQEHSSPRTQELPPRRNQDLPYPHYQQFPHPRGQQFPSPHSQAFSYSCNQQIPSTSAQEFPSPHGQFAARPEPHSAQYPQKISVPISSAIDHQKLNLKNQYVHQDVATAKNYSQLTTSKPPRKRRITKGISVAQTKRIQKKRKQVEEKLVEFLGNEQCNQQISIIITKHLYHVQSCPNWIAGEDCPLCNQICEMVSHSAECQNLICPFIYCGINAITTIAEHFSDPKFVYGFLKRLNISEEELKDVYVLKHWKDRLTSQ